jgi:predicted N-acetyltransferase YhbS
MDIYIRLDEQKDFRTVEDLTRAAFDTPPIELKG